MTKHLQDLLAKSGRAGRLLLSGRQDDEVGDLLASYHLAITPGFSKRVSRLKPTKGHKSHESKPTYNEGRLIHLKNTITCQSFFAFISESSKLMPRKRCKMKCYILTHHITCVEDTNEALVQKNNVFQIVQQTESAEEGIVVSIEYFCAPNRELKWKDLQELRILCRNVNITPWSNKYHPGLWTTTCDVPHFNCCQNSNIKSLGCKVSNNFPECIKKLPTRSNVLFLGQLNGIPSDETSTDDDTENNDSYATLEGSITTENDDEDIEEPPLVIEVVNATAITERKIPLGSTDYGAACQNFCAENDCEKHEILPEIEFKTNDTEEDITNSILDRHESSVDIIKDFESLELDLQSHTNSCNPKSQQTSASTETNLEATPPFVHLTNYKENSKRSQLHNQGGTKASDLRRKKNNSAQVSDIPPDYEKLIKMQIDSDAVDQNSCRNIKHRQRFCANCQSTISDRSDESQYVQTFDQQWHQYPGQISYDQLHDRPTNLPQFSGYMSDGKGKPIIIDKIHHGCSCPQCYAMYLLICKYMADGGVELCRQNTCTQFPQIDEDLENYVDLEAPIHKLAQTQQCQSQKVNCRPEVRDELHKNYPEVNSRPGPIPQLYHQSPDLKHFLENILQLQINGNRGWARNQTHIVSKESDV